MYSTKCCADVSNKLQYVANYFFPMRRIGNEEEMATLFIASVTFYIFPAKFLVGKCGQMTINIALVELCNLSFLLVLLSLNLFRLLLFHLNI
jgi:hypothetical protein